MIDLDYNSMRQIKDILRTHLPETEVRIVGSRANGNAKPHSDVDLLIMNKAPLSPIIRALLNTAFEESDIPYKLDLVEDHDLTPEFRAGLIRQSERI